MYEVLFSLLAYPNIFALYLLVVMYYWKKPWTFHNFDKQLMLF